MHIPLSILVYSRITAAPDPLFPDALDGRRVDQQLRLLQRWFHVMPLGAAVRGLRARCLAPRALCITFDGAFAEGASVALPLLQRRALPATFFVASGLLDGGDSWREALIDLVRRAPGPRLCLARGGFGSFDIACATRRRAVIDTLIAALASLPPAERLARVRAMTPAAPAATLSSDQLLALHRAGMEIGAHTVHQQALATLSNAEARAEIANGRAQLEQIVQAPVTLFAYPEGQPGSDFERRHGNMLRSAGFEAAFTTASGAARAESDPYALPRVTPRERSASRLLLLMGHNLFAKQASATCAPARQR